jgi:hypothetical protein
MALRRPAIVDGVLDMKRFHGQVRVDQFARSIDFHATGVAVKSASSLLSKRIHQGGPG